MPEKVTNSSASTDELEAHILSNDFNDFVAGGIGPDQADVKVNFEYVAFDYGGTRVNDPVLALRGTCTPTDGSNEGKEFTIDWTCGPKMSDVNILNDGGSVSSKVKGAFNPTSNQGLFIKSLIDTGVYDPKMANGPKGIRELNGMEITIKRTKQPTRQGIEDKNEKGYDRTYYHCLKILSMPGEAKKAGRKGTNAVAPASAASAAPAAATASTPKASNGAASGSTTKSALEYVKAALEASGGSIPLTGGDGLMKAVYKLVKADNGTTQEANSLGTQAAQEDFLIESSMENDLGWTVENGTLSKSA
jgi:hypothetical protein